MQVQNHEKLILIAVKAALKAGKSILEIYFSNDFEIEQKYDDSPLTAADKASHKIIMDYLQTSNIDILSEEGNQVDYAQRRQWNPLWIVDPLDGTKEFIKRNGEFTVNIALVKDNLPVLGVIYVPVKNTLYFAHSLDGAYRIEGIDQKSSCENFSLLMQKANKLPLKTDYAKDKYVIIGSRSHAGEELQSFVKQKMSQYAEVEFISAGSSLKFCKVAEDKADIYPRMGPTMEWDTAAGQAIVEAAGKSVRVWDTKMPLLYNKQELLNPWFVVE